MFPPQRTRGAGQVLLGGKPIPEVQPQTVQPHRSGPSTVLCKVPEEMLVLKPCFVVMCVCGVHGNTRHHIPVAG